jgi:hypothetical protein
MVLHQTKGGEISYDEANQIVTARFFGFMNSESFRTFMLKGLEILQQKLAQHDNVMWLADTREHKVVQKKDTDWVAEEWTPKAQRSGLTHIAFILPSDVFAQMSIENYQAVTVKSVKIKNFGNVESARQWYRSEVATDSIAK